MTDISDKDPNDPELRLKLKNFKIGRNFVSSRWTAWICYCLCFWDDSLHPGEEESDFINLSRLGIESFWLLRFTKL